MSLNSNERRFFSAPPVEYARVEFSILLLRDLRKNSFAIAGVLSPIRLSHAQIRNGIYSLYVNDKLQLRNFIREYAHVYIHVNI